MTTRTAETVDRATTHAIVVQKSAMKHLGGNGPWRRDFLIPAFFNLALNRVTLTQSEDSV